MQELDEISNVSKSTMIRETQEQKRLAPFEASPGDPLAKKTSRDFKMRLKSFKSGKQNKH